MYDIMYMHSVLLMTFKFEGYSPFGHLLVENVSTEDVQLSPTEKVQSWLQLLRSKMVQCHHHLVAGVNETPFPTLCLSEE